ncbi:MAG: helix-turn-helix domain-containing protein, partial [Desulfotignum sp.]|nr:helix-turn-helix domain-containing protein [Desulfotignum sp.]
MKTKLGALLRAIRNTRQFTIKDVAAKAGISSSLLSQIERNRISPSLDTLLQLLEVYGVSPDKFFKDYETQSRVEIIRKNERKT